MKAETKIFGNDLYISLTCIAKEYKRRYKKVYNISQALKCTHESFYIKTRGAGGRTYFKLAAFESFLNSRQCFPDDFTNDLRKFVKNLFVENVDVVKKVACDNATDYLRVVYGKESVVNNFCYNDEIYEINLFGKVLIKFVRGEGRVFPIKTLDGKIFTYFDLDNSVGGELAKMRLELRTLLY